MLRNLACLTGKANAMSLDLAAIRSALARIAPHIVRTPVLRSDAIDAACGGQLFFKCENLQSTGAFKARGAANAVFSLTNEEAARGVVTHSSGNHAAALARAARLRGIPAHIVMPANAPIVKVRNVERYGGRITYCEASLNAREAACARLVAETGATLVHPFNDFAVMAGQGTATLELLAEVPDLDGILCPVGGGGLLCGTAVAAKGLRPSICVTGVEPAQADDVAQSFRARRAISIPSPATLADGLRTNCTGERNLPLILAHVDEIVTVSEAGIVAAMHTLWEELKIVVEPSGAVPFGGIQEGRMETRGKKLGVILSGGNVDLDHLPWL